MATPTNGTGTRKFFHLILTQRAAGQDFHIKKVVDGVEITGELSEATTTQAKLARYLGVSKAYMSQLAEEGNILVKDESDERGKIFAFDSLKNYLLLKKSGKEGVNYFKEKGLHERVKREQAEIKLAQMKGELYEAATVEQAMIEIVTTLRTHLTALPAKLSTQLEMKTREEIYQTLTREIEDRLEELSHSFDELEIRNEE